MFKSDIKILGSLNVCIFFIGLSFGFVAHQLYNAFFEVLPFNNWGFLALITPIIIGSMLGAWIGGNLYDNSMKVTSLSSILSMVIFSMLYAAAIDKIMQLLMLYLFDTHYFVLVAISLLLMAIPSFCFMFLVFMTLTFANHYLKNIGSSVGKNLAIYKLGFDFAIFCVFFIPFFALFWGWMAAIMLALSGISLFHINLIENNKHA